ncbi:MAG: HAD family hydrolase [Marmoricola sp.]
MTRAEESAPAVVVDIDGTLVDSNYLHILAWWRAFADAGILMPASRLHEAMGMGGDQLVEHVAGAQVEESQGDALRDAWYRHYDETLGEVKPFGRAAELLEAIAQRGARVVLASSGKPDHTRHSLEVLGLTTESYPLVTADEVEATKPDGEIVHKALAKVGAATGVMLGDTVWDVKAAAAAGVSAVGVLTGGVAADTLRAAGARQVFDDVGDLLDHLDEVLTG